jgi:hypothetical protein
MKKVNKKIKLEIKMTKKANTKLDYQNLSKHQKFK